MYRHSTATEDVRTAPAPAARRVRRSDEALWAASQNGEEDAFEQLYRRYESLSLRVAARVCGPDAAEDAVQAAFLSLWRSRASFHPSRGSLRSWILTGVRHRAIDALRERSRRPAGQIDPEHQPEPSTARPPDVEVAARETGVAVREAVAELPPAQRKVIELAYFGEYSQAEIAEELRVPLGTVKGRTRLAFQKLPQRLGAHRQDAVAAGI